MNQEYSYIIQLKTLASVGNFALNPVTLMDEVITALTCFCFFPGNFQNVVQQKLILTQLEFVKP